MIDRSRDHQAFRIMHRMDLQLMPYDLHSVLNVEAACFERVFLVTYSELNIPDDRIYESAGMTFYSRIDCATSGMAKHQYELGAQVV